MTQQEHLQLIRAKCVELLELAKQRTPGRWQVLLGVECHSIRAGDDPMPTHLADVVGHSWGAIGSKEGTANAAFIASAAGPFEAALASTVAAIDVLPRHSSYWQDMPNCGNSAYEAIESIITSWPLELLGVHSEQKPRKKQQPGWQKIPQ